MPQAQTRAHHLQVERRLLPRVLRQQHAQFALGLVGDAVEEQSILAGEHGVDVVLHHARVQLEERVDDEEPQCHLGSFDGEASLAFHGQLEGLHEQRPPFHVGEQGTRQRVYGVRTRRAGDQQHAV